ncbi:MAG: shikimate dehydrogenase [Gaiellaceae bacterium]|jgi:shikimate dehydrogenase
MITGTTRLVGLIGDPVAHSLSPPMQNAAFAACGLDWVYVPLHVQPGRLEAALRGLTALGFAGCNVTIPHKLAACELCDELSHVARRAGSVNTVVVREDGTLFGTSTDGFAVTSAVESEGADVLLLGAGGAAQALAAAFLDAGIASLSISSAERTEELASYVRKLAPGLEVRELGWPPSGEGMKVVVNATPIKDELPVPPRADQLIVDLAYKPDGSPTALIAAARQAGCPTVVDGLEVLVRQGAAAFQQWTGIEAPIEVMRAAVRPEGLSR